MTDPKRLLDSRDGIARQLLEAGRRDAPSSASFQRALTTASAAAAATTVGASAAATATGVGMWLKWLGIGALSGLVCVTAVNVVGHDGSRQSARQTDSQSSPRHQSKQPRAQAPVPAAATAPNASAGAANEKAVAPVPHASAPTAVAPDLGTAPTAEPTGGLKDELSRLDAARTELRGGNAGGALRLLDEFARRFPKPRLGEEALMLRVEALTNLGRCADAKRYGQVFLQQHENSVLGQRLRTLLARCGG